MFEKLFLLPFENRINLEKREKGGIFSNLIIKKLY